MRYLSIILFLLLFISELPAQSLINLRTITVPTNQDTIFLDSLSIDRLSIMFYDNNNNKINGIDYYFDFEKSAISFNKKPETDSLRIVYKTFPINFSSPVSLFKRADFLISDRPASNKYDYVFTQDDNNSLYYDSDLSRKGSISRGISFGNNQDAVVNSNMDLQLNGKLGNDLYITAAISDKNIPIQPDGTSQQLQEFDKVFIRLFNDKISLIAGDFELHKPQGYFLNYYKKAQGGSFSINSKLKDKNEKEINVNSSISGAIAKGKLQRQEINGVEGNQGPYRLSGVNNETYIIVLAGTEKVYIDGILMTRGQNNDYIIDYNLGEITFTPTQPINKDKRIVVEFEYSDRNYTRFLITSSNTVSFDKTNLWFNVYSESDNKNQPFDQDISNDNRKLLSEIGDNLDMAYILGYDSLVYESSEIRYRLTDTIVEGIVYDSVFTRSTDPNEAYYRINFSYVGENKGYYVRSVSSANGRVYEWIAPKNGVLQGDYMPYKKIVTPEKHQVATIGGRSEITDKTVVDFEFGYSSNDVNTFSNLDSEDDKGYAFKFGVKQDVLKTSNNYFATNLNYEFLNKNFEAIENFRSTEFTRDWNLPSLYAENNEHILNGGLIYSNKKYGNANYNIGYINRNDEYEGFQNVISGKFKLSTWDLSGNASLLNSDDELYNTRFLRHNVQVTKELWIFKLGARESFENNLWKINEKDSLASNSFSYNQYEAFITTNDTLKNKFSLAYKYRKDKLPISGELHSSTNSQDLSVGTEINSNPNHRFSTMLTYRKLEVRDTALYSGESENNMIGKIEYNLRAFNGILSSTTFYEISSGLERETEYSYVEVAPGQGVYTWIDYNGNGTQELDEFEIAHYSDQANFIRVINPTSEYVKTYSSQLNQSVNINPERQWKTKTGIKKILSKFSNQFGYSVSQKNTSSDFLEYANPFFKELDENKLVNLNSTLRNKFSFNSDKPKLGIDYITQSNNNKTLLVLGFDTRTNFAHNVILKYNINTKFDIQNKTSVGNKSYYSEFYNDKNYKIDDRFNELQASFQPNINNRVTIKYVYKIKDNTSGIEELTVNDLGIDYRLSSVKKGTISASFNYIYYKYTGETNSSIAYEILEGLLPGMNLTWSINFQRQLANGLQINLNYSARKSENEKAIHTGGVQIRAFF